MRASTATVRLILLGCVLMGECAPAWARFQPASCKNTFTEQQEITEGGKVAAQVYQQMPVLPDNSPETQYVRQVGERLVKTIPQQYSWPFRFHVIPQKEINAFALPGGEMFVNIGTLTSADSEAELAGVMGHEMAHVSTESWTSVAHRFGYFDQMHMVHEFAEFTGQTPTEALGAFKSHFRDVLAALQSDEDPAHALRATRLIF